MRTFKRNMRSAGAGIDEGCDRALPVNGTRRSGYDAFVRALLGNPGNSQVLTTIREGLLIVGWVAMWRPIEATSCLNV